MYVNNFDYNIYLFKICNRRQIVYVRKKKTSELKNKKAYITRYTTSVKMRKVSQF